jgi:two-component system, cell cycle response regulator DivK
VPSRPKTVLVVEDDPEIAAMLVSVLQDHGYRALAAHTGVEAVEIARAERPDLISLDLFLPGLTGQDALHLLKASEETAVIPVIAVSAFLEILSPGDRSALVALLPKPLEIDELLTAVERSIGRAARWPPSQQQE